MPDAGCRIPNAGARIQEQGSRIHKSREKNPTAKLRNRALDRAYRGQGSTWLSQFTTIDVAGLTELFYSIACCALKLGSFDMFSFCNAPQT